MIPLRFVSMVAGVGVALALGPQALAQAQSAKKRTSFPTGIEVHDAASARVSAEPAGAAGVGGWHGGGGASPASARIEGTGAAAGVRIDGNSAVSGAGSNITTTSAGSGNSGCTTIGGITGKGC